MQRTKRPKFDAEAASVTSSRDSFVDHSALEPESEDARAVRTVTVQFQASDGTVAGGQVVLLCSISSWFLFQLEVPIDSSIEQMHQLINSLLNNEEKLPYAFFLNEDEIGYWANSV